MALPTIDWTSSGVVALCDPVPMTMVTLSSGTWESSRRIHGSSLSLGNGRVTSAITIATRSCAPTISASGLADSGARTASRNAASSSGSPGTKSGLRTVTSRPGTVTSSPSVPYCSRTLMVLDGCVLFSG
jgi:hypothetical protein